MVSNAKELFPEPLSPVITVKVFRGISTSMFLRLCWRAPCTEIRFSIGQRRTMGTCALGFGTATSIVFHRPERFRGSRDAVRLHPVQSLKWLHVALSAVTCRG